MVESPSPLADAAPIRVSAEPVWRVGWDETGPVFENIVAGALLGDGRAAIADGGQTLQVSVLAHDGAVLAVLGRPGQGPGEFRRILAMKRLGTDTIAVQDADNRRLSLFHGGELVDNVALGPAANLSLLGADEEGRAVFGMPPGVVYGRRYETPWLAIPFVRMSLATGAVDTLAVADWDQSLEYGGNSPFLSQGHATIAGGTVVVGRGDAPEVRWLGADGEPVRIARWEAPSSPVPDSLWTAYERALRDRFTEIGLPAADIDGRLTTMKAAIQEPLPHFEDLLADPEGNLWIAEYTPRYVGDPPRVRDHPERFYLLDPEGRGMGHVSLPPGAALRILDIGADRMLAVEEDSLGVQAVALYALNKQR